MATRHDYRRQALTYDSTRSASPSVVGPLLAALGQGPGRSLVDVGGGTGNYSVALAGAGWSPMVVDHSREMLQRAAVKGLPVAVADASRLPLETAAVDAAILISMLHHVPGWREALAEARRVVRLGGVVAMFAFGREHLAVHWVMRYFPTAAQHFTQVHQPLAELVAELQGATVTPVLYDDVVDGSMAALCRRPALLMEHEVVRQTSFFEWVEQHTPDELSSGSARLADDLARGMRPQDEDPHRRARVGDASLIVWRAPPHDEV